MTRISRRNFLQQASAVSAVTVCSRLIPQGPAMFAAANPADVKPLADGWEVLRMPLAGPWEVWMNPPLAPWSAISLPHCFNSYDGCDPEHPCYRGQGWYRRHLRIDNPYAGGRTLLHFEGAGQSSEIYIGEALAGRHTGGYDEFTIDITDLLDSSGAVEALGTRLSVLCDNSPNLERMPSDLSDFTLYGGIYRNVHLVYVPQVSLAMVHVRADAGAGRPAQITVEARLHTPSATSGPVKLSVKLIDPSGHEVHHYTERVAMWAGARKLTALTLKQPAFWSPKNPKLYRCVVTIDAGSGMSEQTQRFGVRYFEFLEHGPFHLNGERLPIRGTHRHEDHAGYAAAMPAEVVRQELRLIKEMGANFIRLAHYQQQRLVLDLCDELGILVWEELPWCRAGVGDEAFQQQGLEKLRTMIDQHANHPSIILWGLGNEDDWVGEYPSVDQQAIRGYMQKLHALAHQEDPTRLTSFRRADFARDIPDVYSPSIWAGWYGGRFIDYEASLNVQRDRCNHMLHTEWGADAHARRHAENPHKLLSKVTEGDTAEKGMAYLLEGGTPRVSSEGDWSESYACDLYDWHLKVQQSLPWLAGAVHWLFKDFTTPLRPENPVPRINQKGVVERDMTKKEGYYVFQSYWAEEPMAHLYGHSWPVRWGKEGELRTVKVYSNCPSAELMVNGVSAGTRKRDPQNFPGAGLRWEVVFRPGQNRLRVNATAASGTVVSDEISFVYQTAAWSQPARLALAVVEKDPTKVTVEATLLDAAGVLCLDARNVVRFTLAGGGRLIDNQGTSSGSRVVQMYNGRARISIVLAQGPSTAGVSSEGVPSTFCTI